VYTGDRDELEENGMTRVYECTKPTLSFEVVPMTHILGRVPLMPDVVTPRIPHRYVIVYLLPFIYVCLCTYVYLFTIVLTYYPV